MIPPSDRSGLTDDEVVRLVRGGETEAFAELVRRTRRSAYRLARRITRNHEEADDVVQESYVKAYRALDRFTPGKAFGPWFLTITARTALSALRQGKRRAAVPLDDPGPAGDPPLSERISDPEQDPAELERRLDVERAFARLSEEHRVILTLHVDQALDSPASWDWPSRLGLRPPERVVAHVERLREETGETGAPVRPPS
jgi:RNA polymerase sigma-70 factor (ECF subfamily)